MQCTSCRSENAEGVKFCSECGVPFVLVCPSCGQQMQPTAKFCSECGTPLQIKEKLVPGKRRNGAKSLGRAPRAKRRPTLASPSAATTEAERRQLTVMFCDLVGSTALSAQLDPEEYRQVVQQYQDTCTAVIRRYEGQIAQHLGDGLLVYFGYPSAHEDDAARAVRTGLAIIEALKGQGAGNGGEGPRDPLQVRIGIHTGLVVIGEIGSSEKREILALGETPNLAARVQGVAEPDTVVMSAVTQRLVQGLFECQDLGSRPLKGIAAPVSVYRIMRESGAQSRFDVVVGAGLTPLVGRDEELGLLQRRWTQAKEGAGQVVLLSGEPGIGKSRLVQELKEYVSAVGATRIEFRCSPYHQNSALYPIINHLRRLLQFAREDTPAVKLEKLQHTLSRYRFPQADTFPLLAALLSLPHPEGSPPITVSPQKQREKTQAALVAWLVEEAAQNPVYNAWEDLHWADPSTLEVLTLLLDQVLTARLLAVLTFRPEFTPQWGNRSHLSQLTLSRLGPSYVKTMVEQVTCGKALPLEVLQQIVSKTDGVPLFVEELTKTVLESGLVREEDGHYVGAHGSAPIPPLAIPSTLQDSLMARLDRLAPVKEIAQLGATLGREFSYELLHAVSSVDENSLQQGLRQLVEVELLYQRGLPPQATYFFKHALIQDTAYQSLLKSKRQHYHQQVAKVLEVQFPEIKETQPELIAHHYTEASLVEQAIPYWHQAGEHAVERSTYAEAISHLSQGLELLTTLPDTPERAQQELVLQLALGRALSVGKGYAAPDVGTAFGRARVLCQQLGETPQLVPVLTGLFSFYLIRAELQTASELADQLLRLAQRLQVPALLAGAHLAVGVVLTWLGELIPAREHLEQWITDHVPQRLSAALVAPGVFGRSYPAFALWALGYPDQALKRSQEALALARERSHPFSVAFALHNIAILHRYRREDHLVQERTETLLTLATEQGFPDYVAASTIWQGWILVLKGQPEEGMARMCQGLAANQAAGVRLLWPSILVLLAETYERMRQPEDGLAVLEEALTIVSKTGERFYEAELYRLKGELTLQSSVPCVGSSVKEAEECFLKAIEIARKQQAKSLELRATMSLSRFWKQQGEKTEAHKLLSEVYNWFTEGFDTKDLQEAKALLAALDRQ